MDAADILGRNCLAVDHNVKGLAARVPAPILENKVYRARFRDGHLKGEPAPPFGLPGRSPLHLHDVGGFALVGVVALGLHLPGLEKVEGLPDQLAVSFLFALDLLAVGLPLLRAVQVPVNGVPPVVEAIKRPEGYHLASDAFPKSEGVGLRGRFEPGFRGHLFPYQGGHHLGPLGIPVFEHAQVPRQHQGAVEDRQAVRVVGHGFGPKGKGHLHLKAVAVFPGAGQAQEAPVVGLPGEFFPVQQQADPLPCPGRAAHL